MTLSILAVTSYYKPAYVYGGPTKSVSACLEGLVEEGVHVDVATTNANGDGRLDVPVGEPIDVNGVLVRYFHLPPRSLNFRSPGLAHAVRQCIEDYDLVHIEGLWNFNFTVGSSEAHARDVPYVVATQGQLLPWSLSQNWLKKRLYLELFVRSRLNNSSCIICTDESEIEAARKLGFGIPAVVVPNTVEARRFQDLPPRTLLRRKLNIPEDAIVLLFVGRMHKVKRPDIVVDVHANLRHTSARPMHLILVGPDEEKLVPSLKNQAANLGTQSQTHFMGLLEGRELEAAYSAADLLLMPSESENFGMVAIEAMASGLPVLVSENVPGGRWAAEWGAGLITSSDVPSFTRGARQLLSRGEALRTMGERGMRLVKEKYNKQLVARRLKLQYERVVRGY